MKHKLYDFCFLEHVKTIKEMVRKTEVWPRQLHILEFSVELGDISAELPWTPFWSMMNEYINLYHDERTQTSDYYKPRKEPDEYCGEQHPS